MWRHDVVTRSGRIAAAYSAIMMFSIVVNIVAVPGSLLSLSFVLFAPFVVFYACATLLGIGLARRWPSAWRGMILCLYTQIAISMFWLLVLSPLPEWFGLSHTPCPPLLHFAEVAAVLSTGAGCVWMLGLLRRTEVRTLFGR